MQGDFPSSPLVSVCIITYNQEKYIRQTLDSILAQSCSFPFEIVIAEDKGTDNTRAICEEYQSKYPQLIRLLPSDRNYGIMPNFMRVLKAARGKYIAVCEGDDYWVDDKKLEKQVSVLEEHKTCVLCCHPNFVLRNGNLLREDKRAFRADGIYTTRDYIDNPFFHTSSFVFRNIIEENFFPAWFADVFGGDHFLVLLLTLQGDIYYINEPMSVYRVNADSVTNKWNLVKVKNNYFIHSALFNQYSGDRFKKEIAISRRKWALISGYIERKYFSRVGFFLKELPFFTSHFRYFSFKLALRYLVPFV